MLPYFRGMEAFSISLPKSWSELSDQQLLFFFRQVARDLPMNEVLALCVCKWAEIVVLCHADKHSCLVKDRKSKRQVVLADWQVTFAARQLAFLESFAPMPVRIAVIGGASAVAADLQAVPFEDYLACENYYQGFLHTQSMKCLAEMAHLLYPKLSDKACLEKAELLSVFIGSLLSKRTSPVCSHISSPTYPKRKAISWGALIWGSERNSDRQ